MHRRSMDIKNTDYFRNISLGSKRINGRLVIPSGIRCTKPSVIQQIFDNIPTVGIITTKSVSIVPKSGYLEPIYLHYSQGSYLNAVGLENPGAERALAELREIKVPSDKFLLVSIFGEDEQQFVETAKILEPVADGFELNLSCPHAKGYGMTIGADPKLIESITRSVVEAVNKPVFAKLSAIWGIAESAKAAMAGGATGITSSNTIGPGLSFTGDSPTLYNRFGGESGEGIRPLALRSISEIREVVGKDIALIGMGGISLAEHILEYYLAGADFFGIGSAFTGLNSEELIDYLHAVQNDLLNNEKSTALDFINRDKHMEYYECPLVDRMDKSNDVFKLYLESSPVFSKDVAGKFYFLMIPGIGEKPFACFDAEEKSFVIKKVGKFTEYLSNLSIGEKIYVRGPYGNPLPVLENKTIILVGGGTGIVPLYEIAKYYEAKNEIRFIIGGRTKCDFVDVEKYSSIGTVECACEDGSHGTKGFVTKPLEKYLEKNETSSDALIFINCGPEPMVKNCFEIEKRFTSDANIFGSIEYRTSCGVGICGKCATPSGKLSCIDGPFMPMSSFGKHVCKHACKHNEG